MTSVQMTRAMGREYLLEALIRIGAKKELSRITVTELCNKAGVNRTTFYKYFQDIPDMFRAVTDEFLQSVFYASLKENKEGRPTNEVLVSVLNASLQDKDLTLLILRNVEFEPVHERLYRELASLWPTETSKCNSRGELHLAYFFGGMISFWRQWLSQKDRISAQQAADDLLILINQAMMLGAEEEE